MDKIPVPNDVHYRGVLLDTEAIKHSNIEGNKKTVSLSFGISFKHYMIPAALVACSNGLLLPLLPTAFS